MADYGRDLYCDTDMDASMTEVSGALMMAQVCMRRLYTPKGSLLSSPAENTVDMREFLSTSVDLTGREITGAKAVATSALLADPRVERVTVDPVYDPAARTLRLGITGYGAAGPFALTLAVSSLTVEILNVQL